MVKTSSWSKAAWWFQYNPRHTSTLEMNRTYTTFRQTEMRGPHDWTLPSPAFPFVSFCLLREQTERKGREDTRRIATQFVSIAACYSFSRYVGNFLKMWAEELLLMIEKMVSSFQNPSAHISGKLPAYLEKHPPSKKTPVLGGKKGPKLSQIFFVWPRHIPLKSFSQKTGFRLTLALEGPNRIYTRI